ncbi:type II toxin-antitoxin system HicA family toxin [Acidithiobacillus sulfuriphilus]
MCILHTMTSAELIKCLEKAGWLRRGTKGSHHVYVHPDRPGHISVPHPREDLGPGLLHKLLKQAGLKEVNCK